MSLLGKPDNCVSPHHRASLALYRQLARIGLKHRDMPRQMCECVHNRRML
jgi:hypothetical protein